MASEIEREELARVSLKMRADWDARARKNARHFVNSASADWTDEEFFRTGEVNIQEHVLTDMESICQGTPPGRMRVLEIGCGAGRLTRALAGIFGEVHAVDVSAEMVSVARRKLAGIPNVHLYQNNGYDLSVLPDVVFDFAFSYIVFQHIPSLAVISNYCREVERRLRPGGLFKFQVKGWREPEWAPPGRQARQAAQVPMPDDTWVGVTVSEADAAQLAGRAGFIWKHGHGAGTQYYWLWFFKKKA
ncbi:MAG: class I SAM-dependent methyltransferase [Bryobacteraceae bacterium]|jgi:SAM-dependent methyltransferase